MRAITMTATAMTLAFATTAVHAKSVFDGAMDYESPIFALLHVGANIIGKLF